MRCSNNIIHRNGLISSVKSLYETSKHISLKMIKKNPWWCMEALVTLTWLSAISLSLSLSLSLFFFQCMYLKKLKKKKKKIEKISEKKEKRTVLYLPISSWFLRIFVGGSPTSSVSLGSTSVWGEPYQPPQPGNHRWRMPPCSAGGTVAVAFGGSGTYS